MKKKFNIIDIIIVVLVVACTAAVLLRYGVINKVSEKAETVNVEITILIEEISKSSSSAFINGDAFYWEGINIGTLKSVDIQKARVYIAGENGECVPVEREDKYDVRIVLSASGTYTDSGFMLSGTTYLAPGKRFDIYSLNISTNGLITEIVEVNQ